MSRLECATATSCLSIGEARWKRSDRKECKGRIVAKGRIDDQMIVVDHFGVRCCSLRRSDFTLLAYKYVNPSSGSRSSSACAVASCPFAPSSRL